MREVLSRAAFYAASAPLILGFLCLMPTRAGLWSLPGYMSMYVYLLHPFVLCTRRTRTSHTHASRTHHPPAPSHAPSRPTQS